MMKTPEKSSFIWKPSSSQNHVIFRQFWRNISFFVEHFKNVPQGLAKKGTSCYTLGTY